MITYHRNIGKQWITIAAGWKQEDGSIKLVLNEYVRSGHPIILRPNKYKAEGSKAPDYVFKVNRDKYNASEGEILL